MARTTRIKLEYVHTGYNRFDWVKKAQGQFEGRVSILCGGQASRYFGIDRAKPLDLCMSLKAPSHGQDYAVTQKRWGAHLWDDQSNVEMLYRGMDDVIETFLSRNNVDYGTTFYIWMEQ